MSLLNRKYASSYPGTLIALYEQGMATVVLLPILFLRPQPAVGATNWALMVLLGVVFTACAHSLFIGGMLQRDLELYERGDFVVLGLVPVYKGVITADDVLLLHCGDPLGDRFLAQVQHCGDLFDRGSGVGFQQLEYLFAFFCVHFKTS